MGGFDAVASRRMRKALDALPNAAPPEEARPFYDQFISLARGRGVKVESGEFGAHMEVELVNDGPVTIILDSGNR